MKLHELAEKEVTMDRHYNARCIHEFIENSVLHMWQNENDLDAYQVDWRTDLYSHIRHKGEAYDLEYEIDGLNIGNIDNHMDIWLNVKYTVRGHIDHHEEPEMHELVIDELKLYWLDTEWDMLKSEALVHLIKTEITSW